jgi:hypothetical protein
VRDWWRQQKRELLQIAEAWRRVNAKRQVGEYDDGDEEEIDPTDVPMPGESTGDGAIQAIESTWTVSPPAEADRGVPIGQGEHRIPYGRELRVLYSETRSHVVVERHAHWNGQKVGSRTEKHAKDREMGVVMDTDGPPELPPAEWAEAHFKYDPEAEITDQWFMCLGPREDIADYPLNPAEVKSRLAK